MKYVAIDYGTKYSGIAVSDSMGVFAFPKQSIIMTTQKEFFIKLVELIYVESPDALVVGLPVLFDNSETLITRQVRNFIKRLKHKIMLPVFLMKEILSSYEAKLDLQSVGYRKNKIKSVLDQQAAVRILQSFLDQSESERVQV